MKNFLRKMLINTLSMTVALSLTVGAYAWYKAYKSGSLTMSGVSPAAPTVTALQFADSQYGGVCENCTIALNATLKPCTSTDGYEVANESQLDVSSNSAYVVKQYVYIRSEGNSETLRVSNIEITGDGANDEITKAIRVAVSYEGTLHLYDVADNPDYTQTFPGLINSNSYAIVKVWYEGTDEACTTANATASTGSINIVITFEAEGEQ